MCKQVSMLPRASRTESILTWLLSWQQTALAEQEPLLPTPMTVTGEQVRPTRTFRSWRTMPSRPRIAAALGALACATETVGEY